MVRPLVVKATCGTDDLERCNQAFTVAAAAAVGGSDVSLWLTGEAAWLGVPERAEAFDLPLATPLPALIEAILETGRITVCSQCAARRGLSEEDLGSGIVIAGAAVFAEEILRPDVQAIVY
ncbi:DsrE family protein [Nocardioides salsibiostraticola]